MKFYFKISAEFKMILKKINYIVLFSQYQKLLFINHVYCQCYIQENKLITLHNMPTAIFQKVQKLKHP